MFLLWIGSNQSEGWPYVLQPVAQFPSVESSPCADTWGSDPGSRPHSCSRQGFWEGLEYEDMQRIRHLSAIQILIIQLLGDIPDFSVSPEQGAQGFQLLWLAEGLGSGLAFSSVNCSLAMGSGSSVCYRFKWPTGGRMVPLRGTEGYHSMLLWQSAPPPHPGVDLTFAVRGACIRFHHTVEAHLCDGEYW